MATNQLRYKFYGKKMNTDNTTKTAVLIISDLHSPEFDDSATNSEAKNGSKGGTTEHDIQEEKDNLEKARKNIA